MSGAILMPSVSANRTSQNIERINHFSAENMKYIDYNAYGSGGSNWQNKEVYNHQLYKMARANDERVRAQKHDKMREAKENGAVTYMKTVEGVVVLVEPPMCNHVRNQQQEAIVQEIDYCGRVVSAAEAVRLHHSALVANEGRVNLNDPGGSHGFDSMADPTGHIVLDLAGDGADGMGHPQPPLTYKTGEATSIAYAPPPPGIAQRENENEMQSRQLEPQLHRKAPWLQEELNFNWQKQKQQLKWPPSPSPEQEREQQAQIQAVNPTAVPAASYKYIDPKAHRNAANPVLSIGVEHQEQHDVAAAFARAQQIALAQKVPCRMNGVSRSIPFDQTSAQSSETNIDSSENQVGGRAVPQVRGVLTTGGVSKAGAVRVRAKGHEVPKVVQSQSIQEKREQDDDKIREQIQIAANKVLLDRIAGKGRKEEGQVEKQNVSELDDLLVELQAPPSIEERREMLTTFYSKHDPSKQGTVVEKLLTQTKIDWKGVCLFLHTKYGQTPIQVLAECQAKIKKVKQVENKVHVEKAPLGPVEGPTPLGPEGPPIPQLDVETVLQAPTSGSMDRDAPPLPPLPRAAAPAKSRKRCCCC